VGKDGDYLKFQELLKARRSSVTMIALQLNGAGGDGKPRGRTWLNEILTGRRDSPRAWERLSAILTAEEYQLVYGYAQRRLAEGSAIESPILVLRRKEAELRAFLERIREASDSEMSDADFRVMVRGVLSEEKRDATVHQSATLDIPTAFQ
jgi:hypothetical protein